MATPLALVLTARGLTRRALAERVGVSNAWVGEIVAGRNRPSDDLANRIAEVVGVPADDLFGETDSIVVEFVRRTTLASGVPEHLDDPVVAEQVATALRGGS